MVWLIVAIPASAVLMGAIMLYLSISTYDGLVTDDYYQKGLQINRSKERDERALALGLSSVVAMDASGGAVEVLLEGDSGFVAPEILDMQLFHATRPGLDIHLRLRRLDGGRYVASRPELARGRWYLQLEADDWRLKGEFTGGDGGFRLLLGHPVESANSGS